MSARTKLNAAYIQGGLAIAAVVGGLAQSWAVFAASAAVLIALSLHAGDIRPRGRGR